MHWATSAVCAPVVLPGKGPGGPAKRVNRNFMRPLGDHPLTSLRTVVPENAGAHLGGTDPPSSAGIRALRPAAADRI